jgi:hypothetical protein
MRDFIEQEFQCPCVMLSTRITDADSPGNCYFSGATIIAILVREWLIRGALR